MAGKYGFSGETVHRAGKFAQVGIGQAHHKELRLLGIKVGRICPGETRIEFALGRDRTEQGVAASGMLEPEDVPSAVLMACTQGPNARIIEIQMRTMNEALT
jgi:NADP-dependent 3-hydroxy acid dehydrogenase YdfG